MRSCRITGFALLIWVVYLLLSPARVEALNRLKDIWLQNGSEAGTLVLNLDEFPSYTLEPTEKGGVNLTLIGVKGTPKVQERIISDSTGMLATSMKASTTMVISLRFKKPVRLVEQTWVPQKRDLFLRLYWPRPEQKVRRHKKGPVAIKRVRIGKGKGFTRIVMDLNEKPFWFVHCNDRSHLGIRIPQGSPLFPIPFSRRIKRIGRLTVSNSKDFTSLNIEALSPLTLFQVFWLELGNRLVLDVYDPEVKPVPMASILPKDFGLPLKQEGVREKAPNKDRIPDPFKPFQVDILKGQEAQPAKVVKKIIKPLPPPPDHKTKPKTSRPLSKQELLAYGRILGAYNFKEYEKGVRLIDAFVKKFPHSPLLEKVVFMKGDFYLSLLSLGDQKRLPSTLNSYRKAIQRFPHSDKVPFTYLKMARASRLAGDYYGAMSFLNLLTERYKDERVMPGVYLERALVYAKLRLADKAFQDFNTILRRFPKCPESTEARFGIAKYLHNRGLYQEAEKWLDEIDKTHPEFPLQYPEFYGLRARNDLYLKHFKRARRFFLAALNLGDATEPMEMILTRIGDTYLHESNKEAAKKIYTFVVTHFPDSEAVSIAQLRLADLSSGVEKFKKLHERYGDSPLGELALLKLANVYFRSRAYDKAMDTLKELVVRPPKDEAGKAARALFVQACGKAIKQAYDEKRYDACIQIYEKYKALVGDKLETRAKLYVAESLFQMGDPDQALLVLGPFDPDGLGSELRPRYVMVFAEALKARGQQGKAIQLLMKERGRVKQKGRKIRLSLLLADLYRDSAKPAKALPIYEEIVQTRSDLSTRELAKAWLEIGKIQNQMRHIKEARRALEICISLTGTDERQKETRLSALLEMAKTYRSEGNPSEASRILENILKEGYGPDGEYYWDLKFRLAQCYEQLGKMEKAKALYKEVGDEGPSILQARAQMRLGSIMLNDQLKTLPHWPELASK